MKYEHDKIYNKAGLEKAYNIAAARALHRLRGFFDEHPQIFGKRFSTLGSASYFDVYFDSERVATYRYHIDTPFSDGSYNHWTIHSSVYQDKEVYSVYSIYAGWHVENAFSFLFWKYYRLQHRGIFTDMSYLICRYLHLPSKIFQNMVDKTEAHVRNHLEGLPFSVKVSYTEGQGLYTLSVFTEVDLTQLDYRFFGIPDNRPVSLTDSGNIVEHLEYRQSDPLTVEGLVEDVTKKVHSIHATLKSCYDKSKREQTFKIIDGVYTGPENWEGDLDLSTEDTLASLGCLKTVTDFLIIRDNKRITSLGSLQSVGGWLDLSQCTNLLTLGELESVGGFLDLGACSGLSTLGKLKRVGEWLGLRDCTHLLSIGALDEVNRSLYLGGRFPSPLKAVQEKIKYYSSLLAHEALAGIHTKEVQEIPLYKNLLLGVLPMGTSLKG